jgi:hypothetical protein
LTDQDLLRAIDAKLGALLALTLDEYTRERLPNRHRQRSVDRLLVDAGLPVRQVASLLGKTDRAVHLVLQSERNRNITTSKKSGTGQTAP